MSNYAQASSIPAADQHTTVLTAAERGPEWMATYGCTPWCAMDHSEPGDTADWHQAAPAIIPPIEDAHHDGDTEPFLAAHVTTSNAIPDVYGIHTELWIWTGGDSYELDEEQTDRLIANVEAFLPQLRAARALLAEARRSDRPCDPVARAKADAELEDRLAARREAEVTKAESIPPPAPILSVETCSEMVKVSVRVALQHTQDVPAMARAVSAAAHAAIREEGAEPYLYSCGEGNPAYNGKLPCTMPYGHSGTHQSCTGETFESGIGESAPSPLTKQLAA